jgi:uncharacterized protein
MRQTPGRVGWRRRGVRRLVAALVLAALAANAVAAMQAHAMSHYAPAGHSTPPMESLSLPQKILTVATGVTIARPENRLTPANNGLSYTVERIALPDGAWLEGWYVAASRPLGLVLMFPPYAASKESLLAPARAFHDMGYASFLVDYRGAGGSSGSDTTLGVREGSDVARAVAYAAAHWPGPPPILYGVSMGAAAILRAVSAEGVRPTAVILESPFDRLVGTVGNRFRAMGLPPSPGAEMVVFWGSLELGFNGFTHNPVDYAAAVTCPALVLHGGRDSRATPDEVAAVFAALRGPKRIAAYPDAGHELLLGDAPDLVRGTVFEFLFDLTPVQ